MQRRTSRTLSRAVIVAVILAVGATIWQSWAAGTPGMSGVVQTAWGPLTPTDRDLLVKVRLACLWEVSTGQQAVQQASSPAVKEAARKIMVEHTELDQKVRDVADKLGVMLPSTPSQQQIAWMKEISSKTGSDYDRTAVQRLREAHGIVLPVVSAARVGTRNDLVRAFGADTQEYVERHLGYLEGTGLVDYSALPEPPSPGLLSGSTNWRDLIVPGLVLIACLLLAVALGATLRGRRASAAAPRKPAVSTAPRIATAQSLIALPQVATPMPPGPHDPPTGSVPHVGPDTGGFPTTVTGSGGFPSAGSPTSTGGFRTPRTPGRGVPATVSAGVTDTGPRHAVRR